MRRIILIFFYLSLTIQIFAQSEFAKIGTTWKYDGRGFTGTFSEQAESIKDTIIQNLIFKKVKVNYQSKWFCSDDCPITYSTEYKYFRQSNDSLFEYTSNTIVFFFHYRLKAGDRYITNYKISDTFWGPFAQFKVLWTSDTLIGGKNLKKWDIIQVSQHEFLFSPVYKQTLIENIGFIDRNIGIDVSACPVDCVNYYFCGFEDNTIKISLGCNLVNTKDISEKVQIRIIPNPVQNDFKIDSPNMNIEKINIYDINGKIMIKKSYSDGEIIDISNLMNGIYFVQLIDNQLNSVIKKFIKE